MLASHINRMLPVIAMASVAIGANLVLAGEAMAQKKLISCAEADRVARNAYSSIRKSVEDADFESLNEHKRVFWDVEEYSRHCDSVQEMAKLLRRYDLGRDTAVISVRGSSSSGETKSSRGVVNATVLGIEAIPHSTGSSSSGGGSTGSAGTAGSTGIPHAYRVTLRMDDGSIQVIVQETTPDFRSGDRVNVTDGSIISR